MHNIHHLLSLMKSARQSIIDDRYPAFVREFFGKLYPTRAEIPQWAIDALRGVGIDLLAD